MNLRNQCDRIFAPVLALSIVATIVGLDAHSASAQSITVTTPFSYCVNTQVYPRGTYRFTLVSERLLSIRDVNGGGESLFLVRPEDRDTKGSAADRVTSADGLSFRTLHGVRELQGIHESGWNVAFELIGQGIWRDEAKARRPLKLANCSIEKSAIPRQKNTIGQ
jgi:hypothetical protein